MGQLVTLNLKLPRNTEVTPEATKTFLAALTQINPSSFFGKLLGNKQKSFSLEIAVIDQQIYFIITCDTELVPFIETQIQSNYPLAIIEKIEDPLNNLKDFDYLKVYLRKGSYYSIATYDTFSDIDPMSSALSVLAKSDPKEVTIIQIALSSVNPSWQEKGRSFAEKGTKNEDGTYSQRPDHNLIIEKISYPGFAVTMRIISTANKTLNELRNSLGVYTKSDGNSLTAKMPPKLFGKNLKAVKERVANEKQILNIKEIATLWHLPNDKIKVPSIVWGTSVLSEPPNSLPVSDGITNEEKQAINFFAKTLFKNKETIFGIKDLDRLRHIWTVGKTGTGKSTMIANMAIDDLKKDRGVGVIDPHGDLCEDMLDYIPKNRINDTVYFNPADREHPIVVNPLEVTNREEAELVVSGLMSIFTKVWANVWSARMEYILRNSFLTLADVPNSTLADVLKLLANQSYRNKIVAKVNDPALTHFWKDEFDQMPPQLQKEAIAPIQNKVGQFVTSPMIRRIIGSPKSTISLDEIMDERKIFIANLSQGKLGEDNAALLGAMIITKFQLSAMRRIDVDKEKRVPFYLYVDEFQNFATDSFIKILSEARKFGLALTLANQYMAQIPEHVQKAILGNAGTLISFGIGAEDAQIIYKEFAEVFEHGDLINLQNFQIALKLMIDGHTSRPFLATTLPLPASKNQNRDKVLTVSRERYAKKAKGSNK
ncbi:type IV secretory system conjugative DNA transfer family protein [Patescibacteria group bacterium]